MLKDLEGRVILYTDATKSNWTFNNGMDRWSESATVAYAKPNYEVDQWIGSKVDYSHDWTIVFDSGRYLVRAPYTRPTPDEIRRSNMDIDTLLSGA